MSSRHKETLNEADIRRLALACEAGSAATVSLPRRDWFDEQLGAELHRLLPVQIIQELSSGLALSRSALLLARRGDLTQASIDLERASGVVGRIKVESARRLGEAFVAAAQAYVSYRDGRLDDALDSLNSAYLNDLHTEEFGVSVMLMHRVQLVNNLARIEARRGALDAASAIGASVLTYLERPEPTAMKALGAPWNQGWRTDLSDLPPPFLCQMHGQIASEHVRLGAVPQTTDGRTVLDTQIELWAVVDRGLRKRALHVVADDAVRLLSRGAWPSAPLWRDAATRILAFIEHSFTGAGCGR